MNHILVIGGTGTVGGQVLSRLASRGAQVRAMARNPAAARLPPQAEVVRGDLTLPETLDSCLYGIDTVFLVWTAPAADWAATGEVNSIASSLSLAISRRSPGRILGAMMYSNPTSGSREPGWRFQAYWLSRHNDGHHGNKIPEAGVGRERVQKRAGEGDHSPHRTFRSFDADMIIAVIFAHI